MPILSNPRHERFAQLVAGGMHDMPAYQEAFGCSRSAAKSSATRMRENVGIVNRIKELLAKVERKTVLSMVERREFLARVVRANLGNFSLEKDGDLVQEITEEATESGTRRKIKLPGKREAIMDDARLAGDLIDKVQMEASVMHVVLTDSRRQELMEKKRLAIERRAQAIEAPSVPMISQE